MSSHPFAPDEEQDGLIGTADVARLCGVEPGTVRAWRTQQRGPAWFRFTAGGPARYRRVDVLRWIDEVRQAYGGPGVPTRSGRR